MATAKHCWGGSTKWTWNHKFRWQFPLFFFLTKLPLWGSIPHYLVKVCIEMELIAYRDGKLCASVSDFSVFLGQCCSKSRLCCGASPCTNLSSCSSRDNAEEVSQKQIKTCYSECAAAAQAQRPKTAALSNVWVFQCCHWCFGKGNMLSALWLSIGKMIDFLLKLLWYQVAVTWESLIHKLWVGNRGGEEIWFFPHGEKALTVQLCSGLSKTNSAHVVFISDAPLKCLQVLGL